MSVLWEGSFAVWQHLLSEHRPEHKEPSASGILVLPLCGHSLALRRLVLLWMARRLFPLLVALFVIFGGVSLLSWESFLPPGVDQVRLLDIGKSNGGPLGRTPAISGLWWLAVLGKGPGADLPVARGARPHPTFLHLARPVPPSPIHISGNHLVGYAG